MAGLSIIFDLDGTLLDTLRDLADTVNEILEHRGLARHSLADYKRFIGDGLVSLIQRSVPAKNDKDLVAELCIDFQERYKHNWKKNCRPYPGILEMLEKLHKRHIDCAVLSNKPHDFTRLFVQEFFPADTFRLVYGQREGFAKKPSPDVALFIAEELGRQPDEVLFVGDSGVDMQTGVAAGMHSVGVTWGFRSMGELLQNGAECIVKRPEELLLYV